MAKVLRARFHGRGGQGMKTASRILGSAAFHGGYEVQDSPVYGAERRGAPMMAFVRMAREPILERGAIEIPHLVVVSDDTLLDDPSSSPLSGCDETSLIFLNTARERESKAGQTICHDVSQVALRATSTLASLSTALGAAAACLTGLSEEDTLQGVKDELSHLGPGRLEQNLTLAGEVYALGADWPRVGWPVSQPSPAADARLVELPLDLPRRATPSISAPANTPERNTGSWRQFRPVLEKENCNRCWLCFVWCPEAAISLDDEEYPEIDYEVCKGCLLCAHECPTHAFRIEREDRTTV